ncbi:hypothetical protein CERSUDRAFT_71962 [Gelatoporia subvermispora B]|uniref:Uncharacterized protein n=1 Tax=Ceriporiopsis subvermispora (strain B) TaxID=914234 RepID=M2QT18_CERS8|nr:hypothetical protein CERSUDRAFT_71962 [Gelatoporia subvermispora B]
MSVVSSPSPVTGYASPALSSSTSTPKPHHPKPKPTNIFSNDGSFLERFQRLKQDEEDKKKEEETLAKKRAFDERFKKRGKRPSPDPASSESATDSPAKKPKVEKEMTQYEKEVKNYTTPSLKDNGIGVRPLVK